MVPRIQLNSGAYRVLQECIAAADEFRIQTASRYNLTVADFGVNVSGGLAAGLQLARICMAGLATIELQSASSVIQTPQVFVHTDHPLEACLLSQYAGWKVATDNYFGMASGPMRAIAKVEDLFQQFPVVDDRSCAVGVLESGQLPTDDALKKIEAALPDVEDIAVAVAPTASLAGTIQVVARSVETALHKLHELNFPVESIVSGSGTAPLPPVAGDDLSGIGRTNDAILYGGTVNLWVNCDDAVIEKYGPMTPSDSSDSHGDLFLKLFKAANYDFYELDKSLFSPAVVVFHNLNSGHSFEFGTTVPALLHESFGF